MPNEQYKTLCLYCMPLGAPSRHVMLTAKVLGLELNLITVDLMKGEHLKREFLQLNPEHKVPTLKDNEFVLSESRAIMTYLAEKYRKNETLFPRDPKKKAKINQFLYFDMNCLLAPMIAYYFPLIFEGKNLDEEKMTEIEKAFKALDGFLENSDYITGDKLTLADLALVSSVANAVIGLSFKLTPYPNVNKWYKHLAATLPGFKEIIENNCKQFKTFLDSVKNRKQ